MIVPEKLSKYVVETGPYSAKWHDCELSLVDIRKLSGLSEEQFERLLEEMKNLDKVNLEDIDPSDFE